MDCPIFSFFFFYHHFNLSGWLTRESAYDWAPCLFLGHCCLLVTSEASSGAHGKRGLPGLSGLCCSAGDITHFHAVLARRLSEIPRIVVPVAFCAPGTSLTLYGNGTARSSRHADCVSSAQVCFPSSPRFHARNDVRCF